VVVDLPAVVDQPAHDAVILASFGRGRDGQQQRLLALAGAGGHGLKGVVGDHMQLIQNGHRRIPALQAARVGGQSHERRIGAGLVQPVGIDVNPGL
jgi:hypothetical protein